MRITFLGTSHGYAEKGRYTSGTLIEQNSHGYLLDAGAPIEAAMVNLEKRYEDLRGIFITHMHNDHVGSLSSVIEPLLRFRYNDKVTCFLPEKEGLDMFIQWMLAMKADKEKLATVVKFGVTQPGTVFQNDDITVTAYPTQHLYHCNSPAYAYSFEANGRTVLFTGDMKGGFPDFPSIHGNRHYNLVVCEMAHSNFKDVFPMLAECKTDRMIINHYNMPRMEDWETLSRQLPFDCQIATDRMTIIV